MYWMFRRLFNPDDSRLAVSRAWATITEGVMWVSDNSDVDWSGCRSAETLGQAIAGQREARRQEKGSCSGAEELRVNWAQLGLRHWAFEGRRTCMSLRRSCIISRNYSGRSRGPERAGLKGSVSSPVSSTNEPTTVATVMKVLGSVEPNQLVFGSVGEQGSMDGDGICFGLAGKPANSGPRSRRGNRRRGGGRPRFSGRADI